MVIITFFVDRGNGAHAVIAESAQDFGDRFLVGAHAADGVVQFFGVKLRERSHQCDDGVFKVPAEFAFQIVDQFLISDARVDELRHCRGDFESNESKSCVIYTYLMLKIIRFDIGFLKSF